MGIELGKILPNLDLILYYTRSFYRRLPQPLHPLIHPLGHSSHYILSIYFPNVNITPNQNTATSKLEALPVSTSVNLLNSPICSKQFGLG